MKSLKIQGSYQGTSGHDRHVREFVKELHKQGISLQLINLPRWSPSKLPIEMRDPWFDTLKKPINSQVMLHFCMPHQVKIARGMSNVNYTMFEATRISKNWVKYNFRHDLVILPSESSKQAWVETGFPEERIRLCPLGVDPHLFHPNVEPLQLSDSRGRKINDYKVRFLNISELNPRKNLLGLLRVWLVATKATDDAVLIIKLSTWSDKWLNIFMRDLKALENKIGKTRKESASIVFLLNWTLSDANMPRLYAAATHYWSMSRGEGWDNPMMEAGAMGLHLIAPQHSAYTTYLDESVAHMIPSQRKAAVFKRSDGLHKLFQGADWWEPDEDTAAELIHQAITNAEEGKCLAARERIASEFTWEKATIRLMGILEEAVQISRKS